MVRCADGVRKLGGILFKRSVPNGSTRVPRAPHPPPKGAGLLGVDPLSDMDRLGLQLLAAMIDQPDDGVQVHGDGKVIARHGPAKDAQIVIVTQEVGQVVGIFDMPGDRRAAGWRQ